jgi:hypothetical protein
MRILLVPLVLMGALGCSASPAAKVPAVPSPPGRWVVISAEEAPNVFTQCSRSAPAEKDGPFWAPSPEQIARLEGGLGAYLREKGHATQGDDLTRFVRQYVGFVRSGRKLIYLNAMGVAVLENNLRLCREYPREMPKDLCDPDEWRHSSTITCDGGEDYWGLEYDLETKTYSQLAFNGEG